LDWKDRTLAELPKGGRNLDGIENLVAPLLASDKRLSLGNDQVAALHEIAAAPQNLDAWAAAATVKRLIEQPHKLAPHCIRVQIDIAKRARGCLPVKRGSPEFAAWLDHFRATDATQAHAQGLRQVLRVE
jgi:hypothetical protein